MKQTRTKSLPSTAAVAHAVSSSVAARQAAAFPALGSVALASAWSTPRFACVPETTYALVYSDSAAAAVAKRIGMKRNINWARGPLGWFASPPG